MPLIGRANCAIASKTPRFLRQKTPFELKILHPDGQVPDDLLAHRNHNSWQSRPSERTHGVRKQVQAETDESSSTYYTLPSSSRPGADRQFLMGAV